MKFSYKNVSNNNILKRILKHIPNFYIIESKK